MTIIAPRYVSIVVRGRRLQLQLRRVDGIKIVIQIGRPPRVCDLEVHFYLLFFLALPFDLSLCIILPLLLLLTFTHTDHMTAEQTYGHLLLRFSRSVIRFSDSDSEHNRELSSQGSPLQ